MKWVLVVLLWSGSVSDPRLETQTHRFNTESGCNAAMKAIRFHEAFARELNSDNWKRSELPGPSPYAYVWAQCVNDT